MVIENSYPKEQSIREFRVNIINFPQFMLLILIRVYQKTISRALPSNTCRFYPSCSHYAYQAIYKYGAIKGSWKAIGRILRCNPFNEGGYDPLV